MKRTICLILGVAPLGLAVILFWSTLVLFIVPPTFESRARVLVRVVIPKPAGWSIDSDVQMMQSSEILSQVITNLDLAKRWGDRYKEGELRLDTTYALLRAQIDIQKLGKANIIEIRARSEDASEAAAIANSIVETAISESAKIVITREWPSMVVTNNVRSSILTIVERASPSPRPVRPSRFQKLAFPIGGFAAIIVGVVFLIWASMIPKRSSPPSLHS